MRLRGDKTIPCSSIIAVQLKKSVVVAGYIQLTRSGGSEAKSGLFESAFDENSANFQNWGDNNKLFAEAKELIEERARQARGGNPAKSDAENLEKFAELRDKGVITEEEFQVKKKQLLGL